MGTRMRRNLVRRRARRSARLPAGFAAGAGVSGIARTGGDDADTPGATLFATAAAVSRVVVANALVRVRVRSSSPSGATPGQWPAVAETVAAAAWVDDRCDSARPSASQGPCRLAFRLGVELDHHDLAIHLDCGSRQPLEKPTTTRRPPAGGGRGLAPP